MKIYKSNLTATRIKEFEDILQKTDVETALRCICKDVRGCYVSYTINQLSKTHGNLIEQLRLTKKLPNLFFLSKYIQGQAHLCKTCGNNWCVEPNEYCSRECQGKSESVKEKRKTTNQERYGIDNPFQSEQFKEQSKQTLLEKYGVSDFRKPKNNPFTEIDFLNNYSSHKISKTDLSFPEIKLNVIYSNLNTNSYINNPNKNYFLDKTNEAESQDYQLFHIFESDNQDIWKSVINNKLGLSNKIYARKCNIRNVNSIEANQFLNCNHLQGSCNANIRLGLYYENQLVQLMTFSKPRFNKNYEYELIRLCTKLGTTIVGGASKLFKYFLKVYKPLSIISYANRRWSKGDIYQTLGFKLVNKTEPNYYYFDRDGIYSRLQFQKHKLLNMKSYSKDKSEWQIMMEEGYNKIYDCGNLVFEYRQTTPDSSD